MPRKLEIDHNILMPEESKNKPASPQDDETAQIDPLGSTRLELDSTDCQLSEHDSDPTQKNFRGRGSSLELQNRFEKIALKFNLDQLAPADQLAEMDRKISTDYFADDSESIISENSSPDVDFRYSLNPYRGCAHGCSYCYARPTHEYLGFNAGIDFETKIVVKPNAAELFGKWLRRPKWRDNVEPVMLSGVTDCYQGCEKELQLTRRCLEVADQFRQPMRITTKNVLVRRDIDLLRGMADRNQTCVTISVSSLDQSLIRSMEPRSSSPQARLDAIRELSNAGIPVKVLVAPVIPGLNDDEIPSILKAVAEAGATWAGYVMLRLPLAVEPVFLDWLERNFPDRRNKIVGRIQSLRGGQMYDSNFATRMKGEGIWADQIALVFQMYCQKLGLREKIPQLNVSQFRRIDDGGNRQLNLF